MVKDVIIENKGGLDGEFKLKLVDLDGDDDDEADYAAPPPRRNHLRIASQEPCLHSDFLHQTGNGKALIRREVFRSLWEAAPTLSSGDSSGKWRSARCCRTK